MCSCRGVSKVRQGLYGGAVLGCGNQKCVFTNFPGVPADEVTAIFQYAMPNDPLALREYNVETNPALLEILNRIDPTNERFVYAIVMDIAPTPIATLPEETRNDIARAQEGLPVTNLSELSIFKQKRVQTIPKNDSINELQKEYLRDSVAILHANGIAHGDIHPGNIGIYNGNIVLIDFGKAIVRGDRDYETAIKFDNKMLMEDYFRKSAKKRYRADSFDSAYGK